VESPMTKPKAFLGHSEFSPFQSFMGRAERVEIGLQFYFHWFIFHLHEYGNLPILCTWLRNGCQFMIRCFLCAGKAGWIVLRMIRLYRGLWSSDTRHDVLVPTQSGVYVDLDSGSVCWLEINDMSLNSSLQLFSISVILPFLLSDC